MDIFFYLFLSILLSLNAPNRSINDSRATFFFFLPFSLSFFREFLVTTTIINCAGERKSTTHNFKSRKEKKVESGEDRKRREYFKWSSQILKYKNYIYIKNRFLFFPGAKILILITLLYFFLFYIIGSIQKGPEIVIVHSFVF